MVVLDIVDTIRSQERKMRRLKDMSWCELFVRKMALDRKRWLEPRKLMKEVQRFSNAHNIDYRHLLHELSTAGYIIPDGGGYIIQYK